MKRYNYTGAFTTVIAAAAATATLFVAGCAKTELGELQTPPHGRGGELVVGAELVRTSEWKSRAAGAEQSGAGAEFDASGGYAGAEFDASGGYAGAEYGDPIESSDGLFVLSATRQEWTADANNAGNPGNPADANNAANPGNAAPNTPITRGTPITSASGIKEMRVNIFQTATSNWTTSSTRSAAITATRSGSGFTTLPIYNWPVDATAKTTLFAYSPLATSTNGLTENGNNKINYTVPTSVANQPDLCTAAPKMNVVNSDGTQQIQSFALSHQLTAVGFSMLGWNLKITTITVSGVAVTGTLTMNTTGSASWSTSTIGSRDVGVTEKSFSHNHDSNYADITTSNGYLMMIPQTLSDAAKVTITYASTGTGADSGTVTAKLKDIIPTWSAGDKITYNIRLKTAPAVTSGDMTITTPLAGYTTSSPLTMYTDKTDKVTFKWSDSWLKIHIGSPINGNPTSSTGRPGPWTVTGPISNIYFFATSENTSYADLTATITVNGTRSGTKTFKVIQAKKVPAGSYIPTSDIKAAGWTNFPGSIGLQVAMRGHKQLPGSGTAAANDPMMGWKTATTATVGVESVANFSNAQFGMGKANTDVMIAAGANHSAAKYCRDMGPEWYLPNIRELMLIYDKRNLLGTSYSFVGDYWSSSELSSNRGRGWLGNLINGNTATLNKTSFFQVRCVRNI